MRILNLFAGIGGNRDPWGETHEITAVESNQQITYLYCMRFPNDRVIIADAYEYLIKHLREFDFIWASPPCQTHTRLNKFREWRIEKKGYNEVIDLPDLKLYSLIIYLQEFFSGPWIVENVEPYYQPLIKPSVKLGRHFFWCNFFIEEKRFDEREYFTNIPETASVKQVDAKFIKKFHCKSFRTDQLLRNAVNPKISAYIFKFVERRFKTRQVQLNF